VIDWLTTADVLAIHDQLIAEHGGLDGIRDINLLASALARPQQLFAYGQSEPDIAALAAAYAFGIAKKHSFVDGNKRTSAVVTEAFLRLNGLGLTATDIEIVQTWTDLGAGLVTEPELIDWLRLLFNAPSSFPSTAPEYRENQFRCR
jgi:death-on-curing protein